MTTEMDGHTRAVEGVHDSTREVSDDTAATVSGMDRTVRRETTRIRSKRRLRHLLPSLSDHVGPAHPAGHIRHEDWTRTGPSCGPFCGQSRRLEAAHRVSSLRLDSCSLRSTLEAWDSTVFTEMNSRPPISR